MAKAIGLVLGSFSLLLAGCGKEKECGIPTREERIALYDEIYQKTLAFEAFSRIKSQRLGLDIPTAMEARRDEVVNAETEEDLFYALVRLSNTRRDRHLKVKPVKGGLRIEGARSELTSNYPEQEEEGPPMAPVRFGVDFGSSPYSFFVSDIGVKVAGCEPCEEVEPGDVLVGWNGRAIDEHAALLESYVRHSTRNGFWWKAAVTLHRRTPILPSSFYGESLLLELERPNAERYTVRLPYLDQNAIPWAGHAERRFPDFERVLKTETFDLYRHAERPVLLLDWHRFRDDLVDDIDELMALATEEGWLDHDLIFDGTESRGGGRGAYALQRLSPKPFRTTFGNLRLSGAVPLFIEETRRELEEEGALSGGAPEVVGDPAWLMDWLENDVMEGLSRGDAYSRNVPFKLAHLPKDSDGILQPAPVHFRGEMVCFFGPYGGSHLDQFAAIVRDNGLCRSLGLPTGGYSNTWEWEEILRRNNGCPVVRYMWTIGHTIRPNGDVLEGNPAQVDEPIPVTRQNFRRYSEILLERALEILE